MQKFTEINEDTIVEDSRELLLENDKTAISNNAGTAFPTENLFVGMKCYRMDEAKTYTLKTIDPAVWVLTEDLSRDIANADKLGGVTAATITNMIAGKEPVFAKNSAFNKNFGNAAGTVCQGNDARLSDARPANGGTSAACSGNAATATTAKNVSGGTVYTDGNITINSTTKPELTWHIPNVNYSRISMDTAGTLHLQNGGNEQYASIKAGNFIGPLEGNAKTATTASSASVAGQLGQSGNAGVPMTFNWSGQGGQPTWLWGGNDGRNHYVYNPANFSVNYANTAGNANTAAGLAVSGGRNSAANQIVRTNGNGYIDVQYINTNVGIENGNVANLFYDNGDGYIRKCSKQHLINSINGTIPGGRIWIE